MGVEVMAKGRMIQIDDLIKELQDIRKCYGNTCVYIRDVSWGALALNRKADDDAAEQAVEAELLSSQNQSGNADRPQPA